jgi:ABC-type nitrate/sulfonate/bicarbonate transport system substrate-binding protein
MDEVDMGKEERAMDERERPSQEDAPEIFAGARIGMPRVRLGFVPLTDCAPLVLARERGYFRDEGIDVTLSREPSWATIRDKLAVGASRRASGSTASTWG